MRNVRMSLAPDFAGNFFPGLIFEFLGRVNSATLASRLVPSFPRKREPSVSTPAAEGAGSPPSRGRRCSSIHPLLRRDRLDVARHRLHVHRPEIERALPFRIDVDERVLHPVLV